MRERADRTTWAARVRTLRDAYDGLPRSARAEIERPRAVELLRTEGAAWQLLTEVFPDLDEGALGLLILPLYLFRFTTSARVGDAPFRFGAWAQTALDATLGARLMKQVLRATDRDDLAHQVERLLRAAKKPAIEWGELGADLLFWGFGNGARERIVRAWTMDYYVRTRPAADTNNDDDESEAS